MTIVSWPIQPPSGTGSMDTVVSGRASIARSGCRGLPRGGHGGDGIHTVRGDADLRQVADRLDTAAVAVGQVCGQNPVPVIVPVIGS